MENETWLPIKDVYPGYEVSSIGRVRRVANQRVLKQSLSSGYRRITLGNPEKNCYVHRLVANAFLDNPHAKREVNHKDGNRANNGVENLEWCTSSENSIHSYKVLGRRGSHFGKYGSKSPWAKKVKQLSLEGVVITTYGSITDAARDLGLHTSNIVNSIKGKGQQTAGGFRWEYA